MGKIIKHHIGRQKMKAKENSIRERWTRHVLSVMVIILLFGAVAIAYSVCSNYYSSARLAISARNNEVVKNFFMYYTDSGEDTFYYGAREFVSSFSAKGSMEVWVIDSHGTPLVSSSGFDIPDDAFMPDYLQATESKEEQAICRYKNESGESVMAMSFFIENEFGENVGAVRYITSLEEVDRQLIAIITIIFIVAFAVIILVSVSSYMFVSSIIYPVRNVAQTAEKIATGDFGVRIKVMDRGDEIDALCGTINNMAEQLGETDRLKNEFISTISHEIRTPLTAIRGWGETVNGMIQTDDPVVKKGLQVVISETQRLSDMVEELLDFSRMQNGGFAMKTETVDIFAELDECCSMFAQRAQKENVELTYNSVEEPVIIKGDPHRIRQAFISVLDNALKYNHPEGKIKVEVDIKTDCVVIYIQDSGCGISEQALPHVKEKFFRANEVVRGSGIGLAVADEIIKKHGGELMIDSVEGIGTTVTVILAREPANSANEQ